ncbi:MAG: hypothetical protein J1F11_10750 [Oscillospiraceae bacterium]|nr:hypothetical protein [Oscillospiraceae bacterium]
MKKTGVRWMTVLSVALFAAIMIWLVVSVGNAGKSSGRKRSDAMYTTIMNSASLCYSIEGEYPPDIEYLENNYGVHIDRDRYVVHYEYFGANIRPTVTIVERGSPRGQSAANYERNS